jgi:ArsR family transcriptional regulator, arsenate/arsenite/antimonite-responsive transcriptional repressor
MTMRLNLFTYNVGAVIDQDKVTRFLTALGDPIRLRILFVLKGDRLNVGDIAQQFDLSRPAISHHLRVLRDAGILRSKKEGQEIFYFVDKPYLVDELRSLADILETYIEP